MTALTLACLTTFSQTAIGMLEENENHQTPLKLQNMDDEKLYEILLKYKNNGSITKIQSLEATNNSFSLCYPQENRIQKNGIDWIYKFFKDSKTLTTINLKSHLSAENLDLLLLIPSLTDLNISPHHQATEVKIEPFLKKLKKNTSLRSLNMDYIDLGETEVSLLTKVLKKNNSLTNLSWNNILDKSTPSNTLIPFFEGLMGNSSLQSLSLSANKHISRKGIECLSHSLKVNTTLTSLNLSSNKLSNELCFLSHLLEMNEGLKVLNLRSCEINLSGKKTRFLESLKRNRSLLDLDLTNNYISNQGRIREHLIEVINTNNTLTTLDLRGSNIKDLDNSLNSFSEAFKNNTTLVNLFLGFKEVKETNNYKTLYLIESRKEEIQNKTSEISKNN